MNELTNGLTPIQRRQQELETQYRRELTQEEAAELFDGVNFTPKGVTPAFVEQVLDQILAEHGLAVA